MSVWTEPSPSDFDRWEAKLVAGEEPSTAAKELGLTSSAFKRANRERHAAALELSREARGHYADERAEQWALDPDASDTMKIAWLKRWQAAYAERTNVALSGGVEVNSSAIANAVDRFTSLADAAVRALAGGGADQAALDADRRSESTPRLPVARVDRTS